MAFSRTVYRKVYYFALTCGCPVILVGTALYFLRNPFIAVAIVPLLFVPGRILGYYWRDLLRGRRLLEEKRYEESIRHSEIFLESLRRRPWIRHMIWLGSGTYSRSPEAFAYNNIAAAEMALGRFELARNHLHESIRHDNLNPLPFHNLSLIAHKEGHAEEAAHLQAAAVQRGLTFGITDKIVMDSQKRLAQSDGKGIHPPG